MFIDIRGSRTFFRCEDQESSQHRYLGAQQWKDISGVMGTGGLFEQANVLLVCTPAPLVFLDHNFTDVASNVPRLVDFKGHWSANLHYEEQKRMIDILFAWKGASTKRDILVLGGMSFLPIYSLCQIWTYYLLSSLHTPVLSIM